MKYPDRPFAAPVHTPMNQKELKELIEFLIEKDITEFELERGDVKVRIKRGAPESAMPETRYVAVPPAPAAAMPVPAPAPAAHAASPAIDQRPTAGGCPAAP